MRVSAAIISRGNNTEKRSSPVIAVTHIEINIQMVGRIFKDS